MFKGQRTSSTPLPRSRTYIVAVLRWKPRIGWWVVCVFGNLKQAETYFCPGNVVVWILMLSSLFTTPCFVLNCWRCRRPICNAQGCHSTRDCWTHWENSAQESRIEGPFTLLVSFTKIVSRTVTTFVTPVTTNVKNNELGNRVNVMKRKVDPWTAMKTQRESGGVVLIFLYPRR
jgi:hypothetical protein